MQHFGTTPEKFVTTDCRSLSNQEPFLSPQKHGFVADSQQKPNTLGISHGIIPVDVKDDSFPQFLSPRRLRSDPRRRKPEHRPMVDPDLDMYTFNRSSVSSLRRPTLDVVAEVSGENGSPEDCTNSQSETLQESSRPRYRNMLISPSDLLILGQRASKDQLLEGLRNALARVARLSDYRRQQTARNMALLQQVDQLNSDMDAAVDALRHQQNKFENERMRAVMDVRKLRAQLAEAVAMLEQSKASIDGKLTPRHPLSLSTSSELTDVSLSDEVCSLCENRPLEILTLRITVDKLETELTRQKCATEKETARLRGQLAESIADARTLRLQLARLSRSSSPPAGGGLLNEGMLPIQKISSPCNNCVRLQKLVDLLQQKQSPQQQQQTPDSPVSSTTDSVNGTSEPFSNPVNKNDDTDNNDSVPDIISGCSKDQIVAVPPSQPVSRPAADAVTQTSNHELPSASVIHALSTSSTSTQKSPLVSEVRLPFSFATPRAFDLQGSPNLPGGLFNLLESGEIESSVPSSAPALLGESLPPVLEALDTQQSPSTPSSSPFSSSSTKLCQLDESQLLQHPIVQFLNEQLKAQQETIARLKNGPTLPDRPPTSDSGEVDVGRLQERLRALEAEVESSADQLKASNIEFLELRERLTNATVERAHLKATVDGLDDQVTQLEAALYERSLELRQCRSRLSEVNAAYSLTSSSPKNSLQSPSSARGSRVGVSSSCDSVIISLDFPRNNTLMERKMDFPASSPPLDADSSSGPPSSPRTIQRFRASPAFVRLQALLTSAALAYTKTLQPYSLQAVTCLGEAGRRSAHQISALHQRLREPCSRIGGTLLLLTERLVGRRPRLILMLLLLIYVAFLHVLLINCWIQ
uniref:Uncharacterized protein n=1 Tax=Schistocephalus solidus TaxID=70667 RepID=A0A0X3PX59_SCHSO